MWLITERGWHAAQDKCYFCIATHFDNPRLLVTSPVLCHSSNRSWGQNQSYNFLFQEYDRCRMQTKGMARQSNYNYIIAPESESWEPCSWPIEERADGASGSHHIYAWVIVLCIGRAGLAVDKGKKSEKASKIAELPAHLTGRLWFRVVKCTNGTLPQRLKFVLSGWKSNDKNPVLGMGTSGKIH